MSKRPRDESSAASGASVVRLNVGGTIYTTTLDTLRAVPDSLFGRMFDPDLSLGMVPTDEDGNIFFDRDPEVFRWVLDFLRRRGRCVGLPRPELIPMLRDEADYFGLVGLVKACDADQQRAQSSGPPTLADLHARRAALIEIKEDGFMVGLKAVGYTCEEAKAAGVRSFLHLGRRLGGGGGGVELLGEGGEDALEHDRVAARERAPPLEAGRVVLQELLHVGLGGHVDRLLVRVRDEAAVGARAGAADRVAVPLQQPLRLRVQVVQHARVRGDVENR